MFFSQFGVISRARISGSLALCLLVSSRHEESQTQRLNGPEKHTLAMLCYATAFLSFSLAVLCVFFGGTKKRCMESSSSLSALLGFLCLCVKMYF